MKTFRPAAASISLGCREFNLCVFVGAGILFFSVCFFSSFSTSSPVWFCLCHFLDLPFWSSLLSVSGSSSFSCLLASWCLLRKMSVPKRMRKQHGSEASAIFRKRRPEVVHVFFFVLFSLWFRWTPPNSTRTTFFWTFLRVCWHPQIIFRFFEEMSGKCPGNFSFSPPKFTPPKITILGGVNPGGILGKS